MGNAFGDGFAFSKIGRVPPYSVFLAVEQIADAMQIMDADRCGDQTVDRSRLSNNADKDLHAEIQLVAFIVGVHLRIPGFGIIFRRRGYEDDGGVHDDSLKHSQALGLKVQGGDGTCRSSYHPAQVRSPGRSRRIGAWIPCREVLLPWQDRSG
jgi:hypothetical protein